MTNQERGRYNLTIFTLFVVFFIIYSLIGLALYLTGLTGEHHGFLPYAPAWIRAVALISAAGFGGAWLVTGLVGGIWLVCRFIRAQGKRTLILSCVFFPITLYAFVFVGLGAALPFAIYNTVLIKRSKKQEEIAMRIHYYSGWFDGPLPERLAEMLREDIIDRKSIAVVWGVWNIEEYMNIAKDTWFGPAGIVFEQYHAIDPRMDKTKAQELVKNASVILMMGGDTVLQKAFLTEHGLVASIKESKAAVIMGLSAGAKNMSAKIVCAISNNYEVHEIGIYDGIGLNDFCHEPYFSVENDELIKNELLPLSQEMDIYATGTDAVMRVKNGVVEVLGDVYLIAGGKIKKI
ncbi:MAG: Type 1 glutamine amidotransferase-like domain-containing protein [Defluviitaleaceae bacterium]|nr:Type 1 glutamine amidotransferase-like domain-containing protein [Defluviitaleaceae bacterium]